MDTLTVNGRVKAGSFRHKVLAYLAEHPRSSATEIGYATGGPRGGRSGQTPALHAMLYAGLVVMETEHRPPRSAEVMVWSVAPPGTVPPERPAQLPGRRGEPGERTALRMRASRAAICAVLDQTPGLMAGQIAAAAGLRHRPVRSLQLMVEDGLLIAEASTNEAGHDCVRYTLAPAGTAAPGMSPARRAALDKRRRERWDGAPDPAPLRVLAAAPGLACATEDPELFFPVYLAVADVRKAQAVCARCASTELCLRGAVARREPAGIWGGQVFENGRVIGVRAAADAAAS